MVGCSISRLSLGKSYRNVHRVPFYQAGRRLRRRRRRRNKKRKRKEEEEAVCVCPILLEANYGLKAFVVVQQSLNRFCRRMCLCLSTSKRVLFRIRRRRRL